MLTALPPAQTVSLILLFSGLILDSFKVFARQRDSESFMDSPHQTSSIHLGFLNSWLVCLSVCLLTKLKSRRISGGMKGDSKMRYDSMR